MMIVALLPALLSVALSAEIDSSLTEWTHIDKAVKTINFPIKQTVLEIKSFKPDHPDNPLYSEGSPVDKSTSMIMHMFNEGQDVGRVVWNTIHYTEGRDVTIFGCQYTYSPYLADPCGSRYEQIWAWNWSPDTVTLTCDDELMYEVEFAKVRFQSCKTIGSSDVDKLKFTNMEGFYYRSRPSTDDAQPATEAPECPPSYYGGGCDHYCLAEPGLYSCSEDGAKVCVGERAGRDCDGCKLGFYGDNCDLNCLPLPERYSCDDNGAKVCEGHRTGSDCEQCSQGYYRDSCDQYCVPATGEYSCSDDGTKICEGNWAGAECDDCSTGYFGSSCSSYCVPLSGQYSCADDGDRVCEEPWIGSNCDETDEDDETNEVDETDEDFDNIEISSLPTCDCWSGSCGYCSNLECAVKYNLTNQVSGIQVSSELKWSRRPINSIVLYDEAGKSLGTMRWGLRGIFMTGCIACRTGRTPRTKGEKDDWNFSMVDSVVKISMGEHVIFEHELVGECREHYKDVQYFAFMDLGCAGSFDVLPGMEIGEQLEATCGEVCEEA